MGQQLSFSFIDSGFTEHGIYEIYKLDPAVYPHSRHYHSHVRYLLAESKEAVEDAMITHIKPASGVVYDVRLVDKAHVLDHSRTLKNQLDTCYRVLRFAE
jgi:hypothetical protein